MGRYGVFTSLDGAAYLVLVQSVLHGHLILEAQEADSSIQQVVFRAVLEEIAVHGLPCDGLVDVNCSQIPARGNEVETGIDMETLESSNLHILPNNSLPKKSRRLYNWRLMAARARE